MTTIMIRCPNTGRPVSTAIETVPAVFHKLPKVSSEMLCPACGDEHIWSVASAWLADEPQPRRLAHGRKDEAA